MNKVKIFDTLTDAEKASIIAGGDDGVSELFSHIFRYDDFELQMRTSLSYEYYIIRSANKTISPSFNYILKLIEDGGDRNAILKAYGNGIANKFYNKWIRVYNELRKEYNSLDSNTYTENINNNNTKNITYGKNVKLTANNVEKLDGSNSEEYAENVGKYESVTTYDNGNEFSYGFNSTEPTPKNSAKNSSTEVVEGDKIRNSTNRDTTATRNDTNTITKDENEVNSGTDTHIDKFSQEITKSGRNEIPSVLMQNELDFRARNLFYDIVLHDIDTILTLSIYI